MNNENIDDDVNDDIKKLIDEYQNLMPMIVPVYKFSFKQDVYYIDEYSSDYIKMENYRLNFNDNRKDFERSFLNVQKNSILIDKIKRELTLNQNLNSLEIKEKEIDIQLLLIENNESFFQLRTYLDTCAEYYKDYINIKDKLTDFTPETIEKSIKMAEIKNIFADQYLKMVSNSTEYKDNDYIDLLTLKHLTKSFIDQMEVEILDKKNYPVKETLNRFLDDMCKVFV